MNATIENVTLSKMEKAISDFCAYAEINGRITLDAIISHFYPDGAPSPHVPSAMARRLRMLQLKTAALGIPGPRRVSKVGRGHRAVYEWGPAAQG